MEAMINGAKIFYTDAGKSSGVPIILIHGFPFSHEMWQPQIEALKNDYRVAAYDVRGHGRSEIGDGQYTIELFVDDLIGLLDHLRLPKAVLCGLSMGGYVALRAVERNPERIAALVLCDTRSEADGNEAKLKRAAALKTVKTGGTKAYVKGSLPGLFAPRSIAEKHPAVATIRRLMEANTPLGIGGTLLALACRMDTTASLPKIKVPTLLLVGEQDALTPPPAMQPLRTAIPGAEFHAIPDAGHASNLENPAEFNRHLLAFLGRLAKTS